ncbi:protein of unknown function [Magnetospirillum sp. XM-1]|nr:protein of unknown function [Magnetospirillum sp. XM-1]
MSFIVINRNPYCSVRRKKVSQYLKPISHQRKPQRVFNSIVIMLKCGSSIIRWVYKYAFHFAA